MTIRNEPLFAVLVATFIAGGVLGLCIIWVGLAAVPAAVRGLVALMFSGVVCVAFAGCCWLRWFCRQAEIPALSQPVRPVETGFQLHVGPTVRDPAFAPVTLIADATPGRCTNNVPG